jgi:hypothetical protein
MIGQRHELARLQSDFYRDKYRRVLRALFISICIMILLIGIIIYQVLFIAPPEFYATTTGGQIIPMVPL